MNNTLAKEILILVLLLIVIMFILGILLYDFIPGKNENIKSVEYVADDSVSSVLNEIKENTGVDIQESTDVPLQSYSIDASDLDVYASENSYESGKSDPFAETADPVEAIFKTTTTVGNTVNTQSKNSVGNTTENITLSEKIENVVDENKVTETIEEKEETKVEPSVKNNIKTETNDSTSKTQGVFFEKANQK